MIMARGKRSNSKKLHKAMCRNGAEQNENSRKKINKAKKVVKKTNERTLTRGSRC